MLRDCSASGLLLCHRARVALRGCRLRRSAAALLAGRGGGGASLELVDCVVERSRARRLWADDSRPRSLLYDAELLLHPENTWLRTESAWLGRSGGGEGSVEGGGEGGEGGEGSEGSEEDDDEACLAGDSDFEDFSAFHASTGEWT